MSRAILLSAAAALLMPLPALAQVLPRLQPGDSVRYETGGRSTGNAMVIANKGTTLRILEEGRVSILNTDSLVLLQVRSVGRYTLRARLFAVVLGAAGWYAGTTLFEADPNCAVEICFNPMPVLGPIAVGSLAGLVGLELGGRTPHGPWHTVVPSSAGQPGPAEPRLRVDVGPGSISAGVRMLH